MAAIENLSNFYDTIIPHLNVPFCAFFYFFEKIFKNFLKKRLTY